jgi:hypothetical protein
MSAHRLLILQLLVVAITLVLAACGGQPVTDSEPVEQAIEIIPRKNLDEPKIAMEPLPDDKSVEEPIKKSVEEPKLSEGLISEETKDKTPVPAKEKVKSEKQAIITEVPSTAVKPAEKPVPTPTEIPVQSPVQVPVQKVQTSPSVPVAAPVQMPTDPNTFIVTVGMKAASHPSLGKGHAMGFLINGVSGKQLVLERGKSYTFDIRTDPKHDVYLSNKVIGWGSAAVTEGVTGAYTYKGKMIFRPGKSTPDNVYYSCRNHPHMGALIQVINPGEKAKAIKQSTVSSPAAAAIRSLGAKGMKPSVTASKVKQKLMFAEMMSKSRSSKRVLASQNSEAKLLLNNAKSLITKGHKKSAAGELSEALTLADRSLKLMSEATRLVPGKEEMAQLAEDYKSSLVEIQDYQKSHKANLTRLEKLGSVSNDARYNEAEVAKKLTAAQALADKKNYMRANVLLGEVVETVTVALHKMLDSSTIVYDLNFATAVDEYDYELKRFIGYEELIPVAIEAKKPAPGAIKLMQSFHEKARKRRDQAIVKAAEGKHGDAIAMLQQATKTVRRALRMVGVMQ